MSSVPIDEQTQRQWRARWVLYGLLIVFTSVPLFFPFRIPNKPEDAAIDLYVKLMTIPEGSTVLLESDWTNSTRGESAGQLEAALRIMMRRNIKFAFYSGADPQAPQVTRDVIDRMNAERKAKDLRQYEKWNDYVDLGFFPNLEGAANSMGADLRKAWQGRKDTNLAGQQEDVFNSPVLKDIRSVGDSSLLLNIHASGTLKILIQRLYGKVKLASMCTGVMGPETLIYYQSGQIDGVSIGLKGVYDMETLMEYGVNSPGPDGKVQITSEKYSGQVIPGWPGMKNYDRAGAYYPTLHAALFLLIGAVVVGNIEVIRQRKKNKAVSE